MWLHIIFMVKKERKRNNSDSIKNSLCFRSKTAQHLQPTITRFYCTFLWIILKFLFQQQKKNILIDFFLLFSFTFSLVNFFSTRKCTYIMKCIYFISQCLYMHTHHSVFIITLLFSLLLYLHFIHLLMAIIPNWSNKFHFDINLCVVYRFLSEYITFGVHLQLTIFFAFAFF